MSLTCDLCGNILTATTDSNMAVCSNCGMEYGPDRLQEKRAELQPAEPVKPVVPVLIEEPVKPEEPEGPTEPVKPVEPERPAEPVQPKPQPQKTETKKGKPGLRRVMRWMAIFAVLDLIIGVKVTGLICFAIIALLIVFCKPWG